MPADRNRLKFVLGKQVFRGYCSLAEVDFQPWNGQNPLLFKFRAFFKRNSSSFLSSQNLFSLEFMQIADIGNLVTFIDGFCSAFHTGKRRLNYSDCKIIW